VSYAIQVSASAERELLGLSSNVQARLVAAIHKLTGNPRQGAGIKKLRGEPGAYRVRVGDYRVLYRVDDERRLVMVVRAGHRREVYRRR